MIRSAKQRRFLEATEAQRGYVAGATAGPRTAAIGAVPAAPSPLTTPGGVVQSGGYLANAKFKTPSMLPMRKVR